jgi:uncharacterized membrane protein
MGENHFTAAPTALYGVVLLMAAVAYFVLQYAIIAAQGRGSVLKAAIGGDWKGKLSMVAYATAIPAAFWSPVIAWAVYVSVALLWLVPDRRIERVLGNNRAG